jgi:hypothetical protein
MRLFAAVVGLLVLPFMSALAQGDSSRPGSTNIEQPNSLLVETWLLSDYVDVLRKTRSPMMACDAAEGRDFAIDVSESETGWEWSFYNIHEGKGGFECGLGQYPGRNEIEFRSGGDTEEIVGHGTLLHADTLMLEYWGKRGDWTGRYVKAKPNLEAFVNGLLLSGNYVNQEGVSCVFEDSGVANWGYVPFKYEVTLDCMFSRDLFCLPYQCDDAFGWFPYYHFEWKKDKLYVFDTYNIYPGGEGATPYKEPLLILTPVKK